MIATLCVLLPGLLLFYTFAGYPALLWLRARFRPKAFRKSDYEPNVTFLIAAHNEEAVIRRKLDSILTSNYDPGRISVIVLSDGSTDHTDEILHAYPDQRISTIILRDRIGKAAALNIGVRAATGELVVFTDARQVLERDSLRRLVSNFADSRIGCASGLLIIGDSTCAGALSGEHLKWRFENKIREWEGASGSVVGALGAFYAARRSLVVTIPPGTLLDDCYLPLHIVRRGYRTVFEKDARVWDDVVTTPVQEFQRKVRTLTGNYQLLRLAPWLCTQRNPLWWEFMSHKFCRLLIPFLLIVMLAASLSAPSSPLFYFGMIQLGAYALGLAALTWPRLGEIFAPAEVARSVLVLNAATLKAFFNFLTGNYGVWTRRTSTSREARSHSSRTG
ncbi:glycosyltransferase family 2 protein [Acidobacteria bacterium AB60]|nr:glycosyltransferase family 2 protein [Acidobacteria bacterium AB60]